MINLFYYFQQKEYFYQYAISDQIKIDHVRNHLVNEYIKGKQLFDFILWIDADHVFNPRHFEQLRFSLLEKNLDIVSAKYFKRDKRFREIVAYNIEDDEYLSIEDRQEGVQKVDAVGFGFVLMRPKVLEDMYYKIGPRLFEFQYPIDGSIDYLSEDFDFCNKAKQCGYDVYIDHECVIGHEGGIV
jgi:hypothetical protein